MCFTSKDYSTPLELLKGAQPLVAEKDIKVWKTIKKYRIGAKFVYRGRYQTDFIYTGKIQKSPLKISWANVVKFEINEGFHVFKKKRDALFLPKYPNTSIKVFIIPKGAKYYENDTEYVSNKLKMIK